MTSQYFSGLMCYALRGRVGKKPGFFYKTQPSVFDFFLLLLVFLGFSVFLGFFWILLGYDMLRLNINSRKG